MAAPKMDPQELAQLRRISDTLAGLAKELRELEGRATKSRRGSLAGTYAHFAHKLEEVVESDHGEAGLAPWIARES